MRQVFNSDQNLSDKPPVKVGEGMGMLKHLNIDAARELVGLCLTVEGENARTGGAISGRRVKSNKTSHRTSIEYLRTRYLQLIWELCTPSDGAMAQVSPATLLAEIIRLREIQATTISCERSKNNTVIRENIAGFLANPEYISSLLGSRFEELPGINEQRSGDISLIEQILLAIETLGHKLFGNVGKAIIMAAENAGNQEIPEHEVIKKMQIEFMEKITAAELRTTTIAIANQSGEERKWMVVEFGEKDKEMNIITYMEGEEEETIMSVSAVVRAMLRELFLRHGWLEAAGDVADPFGSAKRLVVFDPISTMAVGTARVFPSDHPACLHEQDFFSNPNYWEIVNQDDWGKFFSGYRIDTAKLSSTDEPLDPTRIEKTLKNLIGPAACVETNQLNIRPPYNARIQERIRYLLSCYATTLTYTQEILGGKIDFTQVDGTQLKLLQTIETLAPPELQNIVLVYAETKVITGRGGKPVEEKVYKIVVNVEEMAKALKEPGMIQRVAEALTK